ncbi:MAG: hypothetical protein D6731_03460, partial [Planctomycetota bacterium]
ILSVAFEGQNTLKCFVYLNAFSVGLASVLIAIASAMVLGKRAFLPREPGPRLRQFLSTLPLLSCVAIVLVGVFLCVQAYVPGLNELIKGLLFG